MERSLQWMILGIVLFVVGIIMAFALTIAFAEADSADGALASMCIGGIMALIGGVLGFVGFIKWLSEKGGSAPTYQQYPYQYPQQHYPPQQQYYQQPYPGQYPPPGYQPPPRSREENEGRRFF